MNDDFRPVKKVRKVRESDVEEAFRLRVKALGGVAKKFRTPAARAAPDRICLFPGNRVWFVELKRPGETPTPEQQREHAFLRSFGFTVDVIDNINDAKNWNPR